MKKPTSIIVTCESGNFILTEINLSLSEAKDYYLNQLKTYTQTNPDTGITIEDKYSEVIPHTKKNYQNTFNSFLKYYKQSLSLFTP